MINETNNKEKIIDVETETSTAENKNEIKHLVRIMNTDLKGSMQVQYALTGIHGIGIRASRIISENASINPKSIIGYLSDNEIENINDSIKNYESYVPNWMINRRKDIISGEDKHLFGTDIIMTFKEDINTLKKIRAYRGIRHERGLKVRGQRTKSTGRKGSIVGVRKKKAV